MTTAPRATSEDPSTPRDTFDAARGTWTLRSHVAVSGALACPALTAGNEPLSENIDMGSTIAIRNTVRAAARDAFPASRLIGWRALLESSAHTLAATLPIGVPVDLMRDFAAPWSLDLAVGATQGRASAADRLDLAALARTIFLDAAHTDTGTVSTSALDAATALATALTNTATHAIDVQSFVALSQTLPHLLVAAWCALLSDSDALHQWRSLENKSAATDELLRFAGPSRAVFRRARRDVRVGGSLITTGQRVVLMLGDANRDPLVFPGGDRLDFTRDASHHVAFGAGAHVCVGKPIISLALEVATTALCDVTDATAIDDVHWLDAFAIRAPSSLVVSLSRRARHHDTRRVPIGRLLAEQVMDEEVPALAVAVDAAGGVIRARDHE